MEKRELNFECWHDTLEGSMTCSWLDGRVKLVHFFQNETTGVEVEGEVKCTYHNLDVRQFERLQEHCQDVADGIERSCRVA